jgi:hypothetical protein
MPLFLIYCVFFVHDTGRNRRYTFLLLGCCRLKVTVGRLEAGLQVVVSLVSVKGSRGYPVSPTGLEPMPRTSEALTAQYLNVRQRKGTIIIQTVHILQHDSAVTPS